MTDQLPFDAVVFFPGALVEAASPERALPGVPRLLAALARLGVRVAVIGDQELEGVPPVAHPDEVAPAERTLLVDETAPAAPQVLAALADGMGVFAAATKLVGPLDEAAVQAATGRHLSLTKPPGSLGRLEALGIQLAGISGQAVPPLPRPAAVAVFAADHGVHAQGVSLWPQEVTTQMVANFVAGGAAINVLARQAGADVVVVDVGVAADLPDSLAAGGNADAAGSASAAATETGGGRRLIDRKIARGTADLSTGPAMTPEQAQAALDIGAEVAAELVAHGHRCLLTGDMGIANTTASTALIVALADRRATEITGPGAGLPPTDVPRKVAVVAAAAARARDRHGDDALAILAEIGGFEHAALAGFIVAGAALGVPVVVDGVIAAAALLVASRLAPGVEDSTIGGHRSVEAGSSAVLETLGLTPVLDLDLRLGEGTGAALAYPIIEAAARILGEMATFDQAGVSSKGP